MKETLQLVKESRWLVFPSKVSWGGGKAEVMD